MTADKMDIDPPLLADTSTLLTTKQTKQKTRDLATLTIKSPLFAYAHLSSLSPLSTSFSQDLDALQVKSYLTAALRQFLGDTGVAIPIDILLIKGTDAWVRLPQPDLGAFAGAITAFPGLSGGEKLLLRIEACGDYLGSFIGRAEEADLWRS